MAKIIRIFLNLFIVCIALYSIVGMIIIISCDDVHELNKFFPITYFSALGVTMGIGIIAMIEFSVKNIINAFRPICNKKQNEIIYQNNIKIDMWSQTMYTVTLYTYVIERKLLGIFTIRKIVQNNPKIKSPVYDGEYSSNKKLNSLREVEYTKAKLATLTHKNEI